MVSTPPGLAGPQLLLIRHGQTAWAAAGKHTGRTDIELNEQGRAEAVATARTLAGWTITRCWTSPLRRARETAAIVGFPDAEVDEELLEWDYGSAEGLTTPELRSADPGWTVWTRQLAGGESVEDVGARADRFLHRVLAEVPSGNVAVFAHGHLLAVLIARWCQLPPIEGRRFALATATVSLMGWHREDRVVRTLNHRVGDELDPPYRT